MLDGFGDHHSVFMTLSIMGYRMQDHRFVELSAKVQYIYGQNLCLTMVEGPIYIRKPT